VSVVTHLAPRAVSRRRVRRRAVLRVLVLDVGGTCAKARLADGTDVRRFPTGPSARPGALVQEVLRACADWSFDVVSIGYPGPVRDGRPNAEPRNLGRGWRRFDFARAFGRPVRMVNDAAMQALGAYRGGRMLFLGLGTGLGTAMVVDGVVVPLDLAHLRCRGGRSFEDDLGAAGLARLGTAAWRRAVADVVRALSAALLADEVVFGGGNVRLLRTLPDGARRGSNDDAFAGGRALWNGTLGEEGECSARAGSR
jgi:polyphosphate glucokinase